tara:strand:+ start:710 stop:988 length:279 start_codon:yes stop_codon:yes gene_type:complete
MSDFLGRLKEESAELEIKLEALTKFNKTKPFYALSLDAQSDLTEQLYCMSQYSGILRTRIAKADGYYSGYIQQHNTPSVCGSNQELIQPLSD